MCCHICNRFENANILNTYLKDNPFFPYVLHLSIKHITTINHSPNRNLSLFLLYDFHMVNQ